MHLSVRMHVVCVCYARLHPVLGIKHFNRGQGTKGKNVINMQGIKNQISGQKTPVSCVSHIHATTSVSEAHQK
jgi:hypothetical protein